MTPCSFGGSRGKPDPMSENLSENEAVAPAARKYYSLAQRERLLEELKASGLSIAEFARQHAMHPAIFYRWRGLKRRRSIKGDSKPPGKSSRSEFVQIDLAPTASLSGMVVRTVSGVELQINHEHQVDWAVQLIKRIGDLGC